MVLFTVSTPMELVAIKSDLTAWIESRLSGTVTHGVGILPHLEAIAHILKCHNLVLACPSQACQITCPIQIPSPLLPRPVPHLPAILHFSKSACSLCCPHQAIYATNSPAIGF